MKTLNHNLSDAFRVLDACFLASARCIFVYKNSLASIPSGHSGLGLAAELARPAYPKSV
jgi:hypothetical protein